MDNVNDTAPTNYARNGKILLCSVVILFTVVCIVLFFHSYSRWCSNRPQRRRSRRSRSQLNTPPTTTDAVVSSQGLDLSILKTLPTFLYSSATLHGPVLECAVCLSEFKDQDRGRVLPICNHAFHVECIDPWFGSHPNCPLCRAPVLPDIQAHGPAETPVEVVITVSELPRVVPGSELRDGIDEFGAEMGCSESSPVGGFQPEWCRRSKPVDLVGLGLEESTVEMGLGSPETNRVKSRG